MNKFYAGIGSRETPPGIEPLIEEVCLLLNKMGFTMRSGAAPGADSVFEKYSEKKEIYLPWKGFNNNESPLFLESFDSLIIDESKELARKYHPNWKNLSQAGQKLMIRNSFQVLGKDLKTHSDFIVCWTLGGGIKGGTGQAMRIAKANEIPIFNLYNKDTLYRLKLFIHNNF